MTARWCVALLLLCFLVSTTRAAPDQPVATYRVALAGVSPLSVSVEATLPSAGDRLEMSSSRPGDVPELADAGWPALVRELRITDAQGRSVAISSNDATGWTFARAVTGVLRVNYEVDYAPLESRGWPSPREAAFVDAEHAIVVARSLFLTTPIQAAADVSFALPAGWQAVLPWPAMDSERGGGRAASVQDLRENLVAFTRRPPDVVTAGGFTLRVVALGPWLPLQAEIRRVVNGVVPRLVTMIGASTDADYLVVLLPQLERAAESFRSSFALTLDATPLRANRGEWGGTIAHEVFHYWNGWRLRGADYPSSQWFQEGFTEYAANLAMVSSGLISPDEFRSELAGHIVNYNKLATPLDAPGTRKGAPLYSGGALVAFAWDTMIRETTDDQRSLSDFMRALWDRTGAGTQPYAWADVEGALRATAEADWASFERRYLHGTEKLPIDAALQRVGLRQVLDGRGAPRIEVDPGASATARARGAALTGVDENSRP